MNNFPHRLTAEQVQSIAYSNGLEPKLQPGGEMALHPYVYSFADALMTHYLEHGTPTKVQLQGIAVTSGFKIKPQEDGSQDINAYVYGFGWSLLEAIQQLPMELSV